jgi:hypothetical protein
MGEWAHEVREIGNETHTDEYPEPIPTKDDAERALEFANLLSEYLFVLPVKIAEARAHRTKDMKPESPVSAGSGQSR